MYFRIIISLPRPLVGTKKCSCPIKKIPQSEKCDHEMNRSFSLFSLDCASYGQPCFPFFFVFSCFLLCWGVAFGQNSEAVRLCVCSNHWNTHCQHLNATIGQILDPLSVCLVSVSAIPLRRLSFLFSSFFTAFCFVRRLLTSASGPRHPPSSAKSRRPAR